MVAILRNRLRTNLWPGALRLHLLASVDELTPAMGMASGIRAAHDNVSIGFVDSFEGFENEWAG